MKYILLVYSKSKEVSGTYIFTTPLSFHSLWQQLVQWQLSCSLDARFLRFMFYSSLGPPLRSHLFEAEKYQDEVGAVTLYSISYLGSKPGSAVPYSFSIKKKLLANAIWDSLVNQL